MNFSIALSPSTKTEKRHFGMIIKTARAQSNSIKLILNLTA